MHYMGGKSRIARRLAEVIVDDVSGRQGSHSGRNIAGDKNSHGGGVRSAV